MSVYILTTVTFFCLVFLKNIFFFDQMLHNEKNNHFIDGSILKSFWQGKDYIFGYICFICSIYIFSGVLLLKLIKQLELQKYRKFFNLMRDSWYNILCRFFTTFMLGSLGLVWYGWTKEQFMFLLLTLSPLIHYFA